MNSPKILITHASAGSGHTKAAEAVYSYLKAHNPEARVTFLNVLDKTNGIFKTGYVQGYNFLVNSFPELWGAGFALSSSALFKKTVKVINNSVERINSGRFFDFLKAENFDVIVSAHFLSSWAAAFMKKTKKIQSRVVTVVTDFDVHPFWVNSGTDDYIAGSEFTRGRLVTLGVEPERIHTFGIPVSEKFLLPMDRKDMCRKNGLNENEFTVLLITGSFGSGPIEDILTILQGQAQIIVVCARNKRLYDELVSKQYPMVKILGFVDNINELMACSDLIITKPGGLTISESMVMELPPVFISAIPGQETGNVRFLANQGVGTYIKDIVRVRDIVLDYEEHPEKLAALKTNIRGIKKPNAAKDIADLILK